MASLTWEDLLALVLYVVAVLAIGFYVRKIKKNQILISYDLILHWMFTVPY